MANGYTRQAAANIASGLTIQAADHNAEYNQIQAAFDSTTGHDHSGAALGAKIILTSATGVTGTLPVANGGTGVTTSTGTGNVVLSASPTLTGTLTAATITASGTVTGANVNTTGQFQVSGVQIAASNLSNGTTGTGALMLAASPTTTGTLTVAAISASSTIVTSAQASRFGTANGNSASPTNANTNILLYNNSSSNWSGIGSNTSGDMYFVVGTSSPATALKIPSASGNVIATNGIAAAGATSLGSGVQIAAGDSGSGMFGASGQLNFSTSNTLRLGLTAIDATFYVNCGFGSQVPTHQVHLSADDAFKPNGGSWGNSSDLRLKKNINQDFNALDKILLLRPTLYEWKNPDKHASVEGDEQGGFIAQELMGVFPEFVKHYKSDETEDGMEYGVVLPFKFYAYIVKAIQELADKVK